MTLTSPLSIYTSPCIFSFDYSLFYYPNFSKYYSHSVELIANLPTAVITTKKSVKNIKIILFFQVSFKNNISSLMVILFEYVYLIYHEHFSRKKNSLVLSNCEILFVDKIHFTVKSKVCSSITVC